MRYAESATALGQFLVMLCGAFGALSCWWSGPQPGYLDVAPHHGALLYGFDNSFASIFGILGVVTTGWLVDITGTYSAAFVLTAIVSTCGALAFGASGHLRGYRSRRPLFYAGN